MCVCYNLRPDRAGHTSHDTFTIRQVMNVNALCTVVVRGTKTGSGPRASVRARTCPRKCVYHNQTYQPGDKWNCTESDECMFCSCLSNGDVGKHTIGCSEKESCRLSNGSEIAHGESFHAGGPCIICTCDDGDLNCDIEDCPKPDCENPVAKPGECCPICRECSYMPELSS
jgi:hypothetical protein